MNYIKVENIMDHGALPNIDNPVSVLDNNINAINEAISDAADKGVGIVYFPVGKFYINDSIKLKNNVKLIGESNTSFGYIGQQPWNDNFINNFCTKLIAMNNSSSTV